MKDGETDQHEAELERSVARGEAGFRFGCGLLLGLFVGFGYLLRVDDEGAVVAVLIVLGFAVVAVLIGDRFWRACLSMLQAISYLYGAWWRRWW